MSDSKEGTIKDNVMLFSYKKRHNTVIFKIIYGTSWVYAKWNKSEEESIKNPS